MSTLITLPRINPTYQALQHPRHPDIPLQTRRPPALPPPPCEVLLSGFSIAESMLEPRSHADSLSCEARWCRMPSVKSHQCHSWETECPHVSILTLGICLQREILPPLFRGRGLWNVRQGSPNECSASQWVTDKSPKDTWGLENMTGYILKFGFCRLKGQAIRGYKSPEHHAELPGKEALHLY